MKRTKLYFYVGVAILLTAYAGSFCLAINVLGLTYIQGDRDLPPARGYYFASDPTANRFLYYFYYPLAKCYEWAADAAFLEKDPFAS